MRPGSAIGIAVDEAMLVGAASLGGASALMVLRRVNDSEWLESLPLVGTTTYRRVSMWTLAVMYIAVLLMRNISRKVRQATGGLVTDDFFIAFRAGYYWTAVQHAIVGDGRDTTWASPLNDARAFVANLGGASHERLRYAVAQLAPHLTEGAVSTEEALNVGAGEMAAAVEEWVSNQR